MTKKRGPKPGFIIQRGNSVAEIIDMTEYRMSKTDSEYLQKKAGEICTGFLNSGLPVESFTLTFPIKTPSRARYVAVIVGLANGSQTSFPFNVSFRKFI